MNFQQAFLDSCAGQSAVLRSRTSLALERPVTESEPVRGGFIRSVAQGMRKNYLAFCCRPPGPLGRGGGRASAALPLLNDDTASPPPRALRS